MGTHINFNNLGGGGGGPDGEGSSNQMKPTGSVMSLPRQSSVCSLTFDQLQSTFGGPGKDFGSMNMDELVKTISTAEEAQAMAMNSSSAATMVVQPATGVSGGNLHRQGSLTLPTTISQKIVDEVWKCLFTKDSMGSSSGGGGESNAPPVRQQTLGETTLEEFLLRAGVVREDNGTQQMSQVNANITNVFYGNTTAAGGLGSEFGQPNQNSIPFNGNNDSMILHQPPSLGPKMGGIMLRRQQQQQQLLQQQQQQQFRQQQQQQQLRHHQQQQQLRQMNQTHPQHQHLQQRLPQTIFPKQANTTFSVPLSIVNNGFAGAASNCINNNNNGLAVSGGTGVTVAATSPGTSSAENNSLSPVPYVLNRGRQSNIGFDKIVERKQRRMIKNRESAAKSRAKQQAYTMDLEAEIEKLKKMNEELKRKQAETMEMDKKLKESWGSKRQCLRRTSSGPW